MKLEVAFNGLENQGIEFEPKKISNKCVSMATFDPSQSADKNGLAKQYGGVSTNDMHYTDHEINNGRFNDFGSKAVQEERNKTYRNTFKFWLKRRSSGFHVCFIEKTKVESFSQTSAELPRPKEEIIEDEILVDLNNNDVESSFYNLDNMLPDSLLSGEEYPDSLVSGEESESEGERKKSSNNQAKPEAIYGVKSIPEACRYRYYEFSYEPRNRFHFIK